MPSKTKLWAVQLFYAGDGKYTLRVGLVTASGAAHTMFFRTITARAAVRKYIRNNLAIQLCLLDDGVPLGKLEGRRATKRGIRREMVQGKGVDGYAVTFA